MEAKVTHDSTHDFVVSTSKAADRIGVSVRTLARMHERGKAPPRVKVSERIFGYRNSEILKFLEARTEA